MAYTKPEELPQFDYSNWQATEEMVRTPTNNRRRTRGLFKEAMNTTQLKQYPPVYTLCEHAQWEPYHGLWLPSAKQIYLHSTDEYHAAQRLVVSIEHWDRVIKLNWFMEGTDDPSWTSLSQWREEHKEMRQSRAMTLLWDQAQKGNVAAIKALLDNGKATKRGRPSKSEVEGERKHQAKQKSEIDDDKDRILSLVRSNGQS